MASSGRKQTRDKKNRRMRARFGCGCVVAALGIAVAAYGLMDRYISYVLIGAAGLALLEGLLLMLPKKLPGAVYISVAVLCAALIAYSPMQYPLVRYRGATRDDITELKLTEQPDDMIFYFQKLETIDLRGEGVSEFLFLREFPLLRHVDARGNTAFTDETYRALSAQMPDTEFVYSRLIAGEWHDSNETVVDLRDKPLPAAEINAIAADNPGKEILYTVSLWDKAVSVGETSLTLPENALFDRAELDEALGLLPAVTEIDLTARPCDAEIVRGLNEAYPGIAFSYVFPIDNRTISSSAAEITVKGNLNEYRQYFDLMPNLRKVDLTAFRMTEDGIDELIAAYPDIRFVFNFSMFGVRVTSTDTKVVLDGHKVSSAEKLDKCIGYLPDLTELDMCDCGVSDKNMAALREKYPNIKIVWMLHFADYNVRTDATAFTTNLTSVSKNHYPKETFYPLRYCTDLKFLDLGHNQINDLKFIAGFTDLRILILGDNQVSDLTPLSGMKNMEYIEIFSNKVKSLAPLEGMTHLVDLNVCNNPIKDFDALKTCTSLERLWIADCHLSKEKAAELKEALPDTKACLYEGGNPTGKGWREHDRFKVIQKIHKSGKYVPFE